MTTNLLHQQNIDFDDDRTREKPVFPRTKKQKKDGSNNNKGDGDGASIEVARRRRGRPPGSKNRPKPPLVVTQESSSTSSLRPYLLEIPSGIDIGESLSRFSRRRNLHLSIIAATGTVSNVAVRQSPHAFHGRFEILSLSGTFTPPVFAATLAVSLSGPMGELFGGVVTGPLVAAGTVMVSAAVFENPICCRIPEEEEADPSVSLSVSDEGVGGKSVDMENCHPNYHGGYFDLLQNAMMDSCTYSCDLPSDVIWASTALTQTHHLYRSPCLES